MKLILASALLLGLATCQSDDAEEATDVTEDTCGAAALQQLIGQSEEAIAGATLPEIHRIMQHNSPATTDFNPERMNIVIGEDGNIARIYCG